jgi:hypothetical protein
LWVHLASCKEELAPDESSAKIAPGAAWESTDVGPGGDWVEGRHRICGGRTAAISTDRQQEVTHGSIKPPATTNRWASADTAAAKRTYWCPSAGEKRRRTRKKQRRHGRLPMTKIA